MSTTLQKKTDDHAITYVPLGEKTEISLTIGMVRQHLTQPTRTGKRPTDSQVIHFMMLCRSRELNPWAGDAYLVGYDTKDGPAFNLITAHQALLKRAEACPAFDGMESGVIVTSNGDVDMREGDFVGKGERLLGGWAAVYRKDRTKRFYDAINFETFTTGQSRWAKDPAGMIVKCAEASALRKAFPTQIGGLYCREEMDSVAIQPATNATSTPPASLEDLAAKLSGKVEEKYDEPQPTEPEPDTFEQQAKDLFSGTDKPEPPTEDQLNEWDDRMRRARSDTGILKVLAEVEAHGGVEPGMLEAINKAAQKMMAEIRQKQEVNA